MLQEVWKVPAIEFPEGLEWLNVSQPLTLRDLRGKVVLLHFWTYGSVASLHILTDLRKLESRYREELLAIGVHSAKFPAERLTENVRKAVLRYEIAHPVVSDPERILWNRYEVQVRPTLILIDLAGNIVERISGERSHGVLDEMIAETARSFERRGQLSRKRLDAIQERNDIHDSIFSFPGKVLAEPDGGRLFVSDSNHNRIVILSLPDGVVQDTAGTATADFKDGSFEEARFNRPQGLALAGDTLYVADTENHAIRMLDLRTRRVGTIAGTGKRALGGHQTGPGTQIRLSSPWDLTLCGGMLYIAMAGTNQIWLLDLETGIASPLIGAGLEARIDGPLGACALAQPSGITTDGARLYFADSETSSLRRADPNPGGRVETLVGNGFLEFGDRDGAGAEVRLQHPSGVSWHDGIIYVADTYNNKIKKLSDFTGESVTYLGTGERGFRDGESPLLDSPEGLSAACGCLYIADTGNHAVRIADLKTGTVKTLEPKVLETAGRAGSPR
ncbi:MAG: redoxin domain-containing protein [Armatimonadetes bacterium]|nr:redoxin domain-containing protein [Armatimonadota bacterium]